MVFSFNKFINLSMEQSQLQPKWMI